MNWTKYPNGGNEYAELGGLILTASTTGAWSVHDPMGLIPAQTSVMAPNLSPVEERSLEAAKMFAESAAHEMLSDVQEG